MFDKDFRQSPCLCHKTGGRRFPSAVPMPENIPAPWVAWSPTRLQKDSLCRGTRVQGTGWGVRAPATRPRSPSTASSPSPGGSSSIGASSGAIAGELVKMLEACECAEGNGNVMDKSSRQLSAAHPLSLRIYVHNPISRHSSRHRNSTRLINKRAKSVLLPAGHCRGSGPDPVSGQGHAECGC